MIKGQWITFPKHIDVPYYSYKRAILDCNGDSIKENQITRDYNEVRRLDYVHISRRHSKRVGQYHRRIVQKWTDFMLKGQTNYLPYC